MTVDLRVNLSSQLVENILFGLFINFGISLDGQLEEAGSRICHNTKILPKIASKDDKCPPERHLIEDRQGRIDQQISSLLPGFDRSSKILLQLEWASAFEGEKLTLLYLLRHLAIQITSSSCSPVCKAHLHQILGKGKKLARFSSRREGEWKRCMGLRCLKVRMGGIARCELGMRFGAEGEAGEMQAYT
ncbi:hypothetical protein BDK51DRAFT_29329 [Blyttiomyces helicus]|uniref:Uncharacterized protein n=1 Tax=Blyttiomyces helicus TaxID=388810 RepID=A0A4P9WPM8_9FUNG|nr:hypothetical protein BDK51DRAFT_29329 [Blyttiomyces helicus]|eukprot:RKO94285.1 hypothetical protein BDK51DRAFT_29329 [Blyttiomyces helicus]